MRLLLFLGVWLVLALSPLVIHAAEDPTLTVTAPEDGQVLEGTSVTVRFETSGIKLVTTSVPLSEAGKRPEANRPGEGHLHFMLDLQPVVVWEKGEPYTFQNVPPGEHRLMVEIANNDHSSLSPPVVQHLRFRTAAPETMPDTGTAAALRVTGWHGLLGLGVLGVVSGMVLRRKARVAETKPFTVKY